MIGKRYLVGVVLETCLKEWGTGTKKIAVEIAGGGRGSEWIGFDLRE